MKIWGKRVGLDFIFNVNIKNKDMVRSSGKPENTRGIFQRATKLVARDLCSKNEAGDILSKNTI